MEETKLKVSSDRKRDIGYDHIRFVATIMIIVHHFRAVLLTSGLPHPQFLSLISERGTISTGGIGVAMFFMLSGAMMLHTTGDDFHPLSFYRKRLIRIWIPQWIGFIAAFLVNMIFNPYLFNFKPTELLIAFLGLNYAHEFWGQFGLNMPYIFGEWYTAVIILLYLVYPLLRWLFRHQRLLGTLIISAIFVVNLGLGFLTYSGGWFSISNGIMYFWLGMLFEAYKDYLNNKIVICVGAASLLFLIWSPLTLFGNPILPTFVFSIGLFIVLHHIKFSCRFSRYVCKHSYEIYLTHHHVFIILMPLMLTAYSTGLQLFLALIAFTGLTFLVSEVLQKASNKVSSLIRF